MPRVSVVVPNYNHARYLPKRVETILGQTFRDFELILLDDCSTDDSRTILSRYATDPRVRLDSNEANSGSTFKQWNKGVRLARGEYVWIAESDDYADERFLERLVPVLEANPAVQFVYCRSTSVDDDDRVSGFAETRFADQEEIAWDQDFREEGRNICGRHMVGGNLIHNASAVLFRKSGYDEVGGADETLRLCGDWKFWASLMLLGQMAYVAEPLNYFRFHSGTVRSTLDASKRNIIEWLSTARWVLDRVNASGRDLQKARAELANRWVPAILSFHLACSAKREIWARVQAVDPHPLRRIWGPAFTTARLKFERHWRMVRTAVSPTAKVAANG